MIKNKTLNQNNRILSFLMIIALVAITVGITTPTTLVTAEMPSSYDLREMGYVTSVKNQGAANTCWVFSSIGAIESSLIVGGYADSTIDLSEAHLGWFAINSAISDSTDLTYGDGVSVHNPYQYSGNDLYVIWSIARGFGLELEEFAEYNEKYPNSTNVRDTARNVSEYTVTSLDIYEKDQILEIKSEILSNGALMGTFNDDYAYYNKSTNGYCFYENTYTASNHAIMIVGWDDNFSRNNFGKEKPSSDGAWLCKNSRGTSWGDDGYFWLSYETSSLKRIVSYKAEPTFDDIYQIYQYDGYGYSKSLSINDSGIFYTSNIFDATESGILEKVALYSATADTKQEISVYSLNDQYTSPTDGILLSRHIVETQEIGYTLCTLPSPADIEKGKAFSIVIKTTGEGRIKAYSEGTENRSSVIGKSFVSADGISWIDTAENNFGNLCIKAWVNNEVYESPDLQNIYTSMLSISNEYYENNTLSDLLELCDSILNTGGTERDILNNYLRLLTLQQKYENTFSIENVDQFLAFSELVNSGNDFSNTVVELKCNLDFSGMDFVMPAVFGGLFNGNHHTISGISFNGTTSSGLFGHILPHGCLKDLIVSTSSFSSPNYSGGICSNNEGLIIGCAFLGTVSSDYLEAGGICGFNEGIIRDCFTECLSETNRFGSIAGNNSYGNIFDCISTNKMFCYSGNKCNNTFSIEFVGQTVLINGQNVSYKPFKALCAIYSDFFEFENELIYTGLSTNQFIFSVLGDVDCNGILTTSDYIVIKSNLITNELLDEYQSLSADINKDKMISSTDYILLKSHLICQGNIYN